MEGRCRFTVRYDGTDFAGSQVQPGERTVAGTLTQSLELLTGQEIHLLLASRTDRGVHADGNVAAFDARLTFPVEKLPQLMSGSLPADVSVRDASLVEQDFHPRFSAKRREYVYRIYCSGDLPVDRVRYTAMYQGSWDQKAVAEVLAGIEGEHKFHNFAQGNPDPEECMCTIREASQVAKGPELWLRFKGDRFLRNMVCRLVGAIMLVAGGKLQASEMLAALDGEMGFKLTPAPAKGLTLKQIEY